MGRADPVRQLRDPPVDVPRGHRRCGCASSAATAPAWRRRTSSPNAGAREAAASAKEMAEVAAPDPLFPGLAPRRPFRRWTGSSRTRPSRPRDARRDRRAADRARVPRGSSRPARSRRPRPSSASRTPRGSRAGRPATLASLTTVMTGGEHGSGFAETFSGSSEFIDPDALGARAADKAVRSQSPSRAGPGDVPGRAGAGGRGHAGGVPRVRRVRRTRLHRGSLVLQREGGPAGGRALDLASGTTAPTRARSARRSTSRAFRASAST